MKLKCWLLWAFFKREVCGKLTNPFSSTSFFLCSFQLIPAFCLRLSEVVHEITWCSKIWVQPAPSHREVFRNTQSLAITNFCTSTKTEDNGFGSEPCVEEWSVTGFSGKLRCSNLIHHSNTIKSVAVGLLGVREKKAGNWEEAGVGRQQGLTYR